MKQLRIAIYMRLSKEDETIHDESNSIMNQRMLLKKYVSEHFGQYILLEFQDDGYTGLNFERPGIKELLRLVQNNAIDCIVVKDFSRFSRDYIELGSYLEQIFPFMGVRFISINDRYDSLGEKNGIGMDIAFRTLIYDLYSKDLSAKVKTALTARKQQGQYVSGNVPFGYRRADNDRHMLVIEEDEAEIVRRIFTLTEEGKTSAEIARLFNEEKLMTPIQFRIAKEHINRKPKGRGFQWTNTTICSIINNQIYAGDVVYGKYEQKEVGGKNHIKPKEEWKVFYNHHEAIVDRVIFEGIQQRRRKSHYKRDRRLNSPTGKIICGCCGKALVRRKQSLNPYYTCGYRYTNGYADCVKKVNAAFLEQFIFFQLQRRFSDSGNSAAIANELMEAGDLKSIVDKYIERIIIHDENDIKIVWNANDSFCTTITPERKI